MTQYFDPQRLGAQQAAPTTSADDDLDRIQRATQSSATSGLQGPTQAPAGNYSLPKTAPAAPTGGTGGGSSSFQVTQSPTDALLGYSVNPTSPDMNRNEDLIDVAKRQGYVLGGNTGYVPAASKASQELAQGAAAQQAQIGSAQLGLAGQSQTAGGQYADSLVGQGAGMGAYGQNQANVLHSQARDTNAMADWFAGQGSGAANRSGPEADFGAQTSALNQSQGAVDQLLGLEARQGPSAAQAQMQLGLNAAAAQNRSIARSARGYGGDASAMSEASLNNATMGANVANQAAVLKAQEDAAARQRAAANLGTGAQIQQAAAQQFGNQAQANVQNALQSRQINDAASANLYNTALQANQIAGSQQQAAGQLGLSGLQAGAAATAQGGQMDLASMAQAGQLNTAAAQNYLAGAQQQQNALTFGAQLAQQQLAASEAYEQARLQEYGIRKGVAIQQAANTANMIGAGISAAGALAGGAAMMSDIRAKDRIKPMSAVEALLSPGDSLLDERTGEERDAEDDPYRLDYGTPGTARKTPYRTGEDMDAADSAGVAAAPTTSYQGPDRDGMAEHMTAGAESLAKRNAEESRQSAKRRAGIGKMIGALDSFRNVGNRGRAAGQGFIDQYVTSDEKEKTDLRPAKGYSYEYKDPERNGKGRFYGPMAQDLLKTPAGKSAVVRQPDGSLGVDTGRLSLTNTSAIGEQQRRQDDVDERVSALEQLLAEEPPRRRAGRAA